MNFFKEKQKFKELTETSTMTVTQQPREFHSSFLSPDDLYSILLYCAVLGCTVLYCTFSVVERTDHVQAEATPLPK